MASINTGSGQELLSLAGHTSLIFGIDFSPDGKSLASASFDGSVRIWDVRPEGRGEGGVIVNGKATGPEWTPAIALSPDGTRLATTNADITPKVLEASSGNSLRTLSGHLDRVQRIEFSSDGAYIVTTG
jgi:WD40 repeat protein